MTDEIKPLLARLPEPAPPPTLMATVMARVAREADQRVVRARAPRRREWAAWVWTLSGAALVLAVTVYAWVDGGAAVPMPSLVQGPAVPLVAAGVLLYLFGLFAPLRTIGRRQ